MPATLEQTGPNVVTPRSVFILRFISTVASWSVALLIMFSGYEILFWLLISVFGMIGLWEFYRMLDHKGLPNFKITGMICGAVMLAGSFYYFSKMGPAGSYDFEVAVLLFFLLTMFGRQMFARLRHDEPLQTMAYTLFGLLYVLWLFNFITKIVYLTPRSSTGQLTGQFYVLYLIAVTKFSDMRAYLTGRATWRNRSSSAAPTSRIRGICSRELEARSIYWTACFSPRHCYFFICDSSFAFRKDLFHTKATTDAKIRRAQRTSLPVVSRRDRCVRP